MDPVTLFLCGDVMTGRGIDQVLRRSVDPALHEPYVKSARRYVELAEAENGPIPAPAGADYVWGEALAELERADPAARIVNLETAVTTSLDGSGSLEALEMTPLRIRRFRLERAPAEDARWLRDRLDRECRELGCRVARTEEGRLALRWR